MIGTLAILLALLGNAHAVAPAFEKERQSERTEFYQVSSGIEGESFVIRYWVRFDGLVEFTLYDARGRRMGYYSVVRTQGDYAVEMALHRLPKNTRLKYQFRYKDKLYPGEFLVPDMGGA